MRNPRNILNLSRNLVAACMQLCIYVCRVVARKILVVGWMLGRISIDFGTIFMRFLQGWIHCPWHVCL